MESLTVAVNIAILGKWSLVTHSDFLAQTMSSAGSPGLRSGRVPLRST
jgi:hypothetical protein